MKSSGIRRGLAVSAVTALAFAGLAVTPGAQAQTIAESGTPLTLYSQFNGEATSQGTITLLAGTPNPDGGDNVNHMRFSFSPDGITWTNISGNIVPTDGVATFEWAAPVGTWDVRVQSFDNGSVEIDSDIVSGVDVAANFPSGDFSNALFADAGTWEDGELVARGTIANGTDAVNVSARGPEATTASNPATIESGPQTFTGVLDLGANDTGDAEDQVVIGADMVDLDPPNGITDDVSVVTVYQQEVDLATRALAPGSAANVPDGSGADTDYVLSVVDQNGAPIYGVDVYEANGTGAPDDGNGEPVDGETDVDGEFEVTLNEADTDNVDDLDPATDAQLTYYVVDVNQDGNYDSGLDWLFDIRQSRFAQIAQTLEITNELGDLMDDDETSDVTFTVEDQFGNPVAGADVEYQINREGTHEDPTDTETYADNAAAVTDANGVATIPFSSHNDETEEVTIDAYVNNDGNPNPTPGDAIDSYVIETDTTDVLWDSGNQAQALVGSTPTYSGILVQQNLGNPLPDRSLDVDFSSGAGSPGNAILAPQPQQPAGTTRGSDTEANVVTRADGTFGVAVTDPVPPPGQELGATLTVSTDALPNGLDAENDPQDLNIDFLRTLAVTEVEIHNFDDGSLDSLWSPFAGDDNLQPGKLGQGYVEAYNADGVQLYDVNVPVIISEGNFVDLDDPTDPTPAVGAPGGEWSNAGKSTTVNTGDGDPSDGDGVFIINIERNPGFDDDGFVEDEVTAGTGAASFEYDFEWNTRDIPLNSGSFTVELSDNQESTILPQARAGDPFGSGQVVSYDVIATDQYGNRTQQGFTVTDNSPIADVDPTGLTQYTLDGPAITADSPSATNQALEVELSDQTTTVYVDDPFTGEFDPSDPFFFPNLFDVTTADVEEETDTINWYDLDLEASTFTFSQSGPNKVPAQSAVTMVLHAEDQEGQAIGGLGVDFLRGGPGNEDDEGCGAGAPCFFVNQAGNAFYDFVGGSQGTATISAVVYDDDGVRFGTVGTDTVIFGPQERVKIRVNMTSRNQGNKDVLKVDVRSSAGGAKVKLMKKVGGGWKQVGKAKTLNSLGNTTFKVADKNGNRGTKYRAQVSGTVDTAAGRSKVVTQR